MTASTRYDCIVVGGGVSGTALLYQLARFTDLRRLLLLEKLDRPAQLNSNVRHNSQTLHCGDVETDYSLDKALKVKRLASMVVNYTAKLPPRQRDKILQRMPKMVLGVGARECAAIRRRHEAFKGAFPHLRLLERQDIADIEPNVALVDGAWRREEIVASGAPDEYCAIDFQALSESFSAQCVRMDRDGDRFGDKQVNQLYSTEVAEIANDGTDYVLTTSRGLMLARSVVVCAGGESLALAQKMGLGLQYACLPLRGTYFLAPDALNGKVYRMRNVRSPFAAVHGYRDIKEAGKTRFGPSARILPLLERYTRARMCDLFGIPDREPRLAGTLWALLGAGEIRHEVVRHLLYELPRLGHRLFVKEIRKIVPDIKVRDIEPARGAGGIRPQLVDLNSRSLEMGEVKITDGQGAVFSIALSPGAAGCLGNAEEAMRLVAAHTCARVDWDAFGRDLLSGQDSADEQPLSALAEAS